MRGGGLAEARPHLLQLLLLEGRLALLVLLLALQLVDRLVTFLQTGLESLELRVEALFDIFLDLLSDGLSQLLLLVLLLQFFRLFPCFLRLKLSRTSVFLLDELIQCLLDGRRNFLLLILNVAFHLCLEFAYHDLVLFHSVIGIGQLLGKLLGGLVLLHLEGLVLLLDRLQLVLQIHEVGVVFVHDVLLDPLEELLLLGLRRCLVLNLPELMLQQLFFLRSDLRHVVVSMAPFVVVQEVAIGRKVLEAFLALGDLYWRAFGLLQDLLVGLEGLALDLQVTLEVDDTSLLGFYLVFEGLAAGELVLVLLLSELQLALRLLLRKE